VFNEFEETTARRIDICLKEVGKLPAVNRIIVFGSRIKGNSREDSDLDVAVFFDLDESKMLECYRKLVKICAIPEVDIQIQAFPAEELKNPSGIVGEIVNEGVIYHCP